MKKLLKILAAILLVIGVIFVLGPTPDNDTQITFDPADLGDDPVLYLADSEANVENLRPGAEKEIVWANPSTRAKTDLAIVYIHGFSATKYEARPVPDQVAKRLGANLYFTRLAGHGRDGAGLAEATVSDWTNDYAEAIAIGEAIGEKVVVMAMSNGGTISTWGLAQDGLSENVVGVVLISPNYELHGIPTWVANMPWSETLLPALAGENRSWEPSNEQHGKWWTTSYPSSAIFPMTSLMKEVEEIDKSTIEQPVYIIYSKNDKVVVPAAIEQVAEEWGGPVKLETLDSATDPVQHVIVGDVLSPGNTQTATEKIHAWIDAL